MTIEHVAMYVSVGSKDAVSEAKSLIKKVWEEYGKSI